MEFRSENNMYGKLRKKIIPDKSVLKSTKHEIDPKISSSTNGLIPTLSPSRSVTPTKTKPIKPSESELNNRRKEMKGYENFRYPLSCSLPATHIDISKSLEHSIQGIFVEDVSMHQTNNIIFPQDDDSEITSNDIYFTEGFIIRDNYNRLTCGLNVDLAKTWNIIEEFELSIATVNSTGHTFYKEIHVIIPNHCIFPKTTVYLLEKVGLKPDLTSNDNSTGSFLIPFTVQTVNEDHVICIPKKFRGHTPLIPKSFEPSVLYIPPLVEKNDLCEILNQALVHQSVTVAWNNSTEQYNVYQKDKNHAVSYPTMFPGEKDIFRTKISPRPYANIQDFCQELERCLNPPIVTLSNKSFSINGKLITLEEGEYTTVNLCKHIEGKVMATMEWDLINNVSVSYHYGVWSLERISPFTLEFAKDSIIERMGFTEQHSPPKTKFTSQFPVFYPFTRAAMEMPFNRYVVRYDEKFDQFAIHPVSKNQLMKSLYSREHSHSEKDHIVMNQLVFPFKIIDEITPFIKTLPMKIHDQYYISSTGISSSLSCPNVLYLVIPELEGSIKVNGVSKFSSCMAILHLLPNKKSYKSQNMFKHGLLSEEVENSSPKRINIKDSTKQLTLKFYTVHGDLYDVISNWSGNISLSIIV
jgi:hypothetical protein